MERVCQPGAIGVEIGEKEGCGSSERHGQGLPTTGEANAKSWRIKGDSQVK